MEKNRGCTYALARLLAHQLHGVVQESATAKNDERGTLPRRRLLILHELVARVGDEGRDEQQMERVGLQTVVGRQGSTLLHFLVRLIAMVGKGTETGCGEQLRHTLGQFLTPAQVVTRVEQERRHKGQVDSVDCFGIECHDELMLQHKFILTACRGPFKTEPHLSQDITQTG